MSNRQHRLVQAVQPHIRGSSSRHAKAGFIHIHLCPHFHEDLEKPLTPP